MAMREAPASTATMLALVLAVWLLAGLAYWTAVPINIVLVMLLVGNAAAVSEWMLVRHHRSHRGRRV